MSTTYKGMPGDVNAGNLLLIDDGKVSLRAVEVTETDIVTEAVEGGVVSQQGHQPAGRGRERAGHVGEGHRGPALGAAARRRPHRPVFVRSAADLADVQRIMDEEGKRLPVIAKIEKPRPSTTSARSSTRSTA